MALVLLRLIFNWILTPVLLQATEDGKKGNRWGPVSLFVNNFVDELCLPFLSIQAVDVNQQGDASQED